MMSETNTASCGGFPGLSDSFAAALWGIDVGLQLAQANFSNALLQAGSQDTFYNVRRFVLKILVLYLELNFSALRQRYSRRLDNRVLCLEQRRQVEEVDLGRRYSRQLYSKHCQSAI